MPGKRSIWVLAMARMNSVITQAADMRSYPTSLRHASPQTLNGDGDLGFPTSLSMPLSSSPARMTPALPVVESIFASSGREPPPRRAIRQGEKKKEKGPRSSEGQIRTGLVRLSRGTRFEGFDGVV